MSTVFKYPAGIRQVREPLIEYACYTVARTPGLFVLHRDRGRHGKPPMHAWVGEPVDGGLWAGFDTVEELYSYATLAQVDLAQFAAKMQDCYHYATAPEEQGMEPLEAFTHARDQFALLTGTDPIRARSLDLARKKLADSISTFSAANGIDAYSGEVL